MRTDHSGFWFRPKSFGYGAGLPIAWQGWVAFLVFAALVMVASALTGPIRVVVIVLAVVGLALVAALKTEGGLRWRWGDRR